MIKTNTYDYKCPSCDAILKFDPHGQNWKCDYCHNEYTLEQLEEYNKKRGSGDLKHEHAVKLEKDFNGMDIYTCNNCGAQIVADANTSATFCVYCKNTAILKNKLVDAFNPDYVIPFKYTKEDAIKKFQQLQKPLMPKFFNDAKNIEELKGIYIPFWLYDYSSSGTVDFEAKKVSSWVSGDYRYTKTDIYEVNRGGTIDFDNVPVDGAKHFDNDVMNSIEPFDYKDLKPFNYSYLSGFLAEKYDVNNEEARMDAERRISSSFEEILRNDVSGYTSVSTKRKHINNTPTTDKTIYAGWKEYNAEKQVIVHWDKEIFIVDKDSSLPLNKYNMVTNDVIAHINLVYNNSKYRDKVLFVTKKNTIEKVLIDGEKYQVGDEYQFSDNTKIVSQFKEDIIYPQLPKLKGNDIIGFFTEPVGGIQITDLNNITENTTLYVHYSFNNKVELMTLPDSPCVNNEVMNLTLNYNYDNKPINTMQVPINKQFVGWNLDGIIYYPGTKIIKREMSDFSEYYEMTTNIDKLSLQPVREGYVFMGWFDKAIDGLFVDLDKIATTRTVYTLLPVWLLNIKYKDNMHTFAMNGQTGKLIGDIPVDVKKAFFYWILTFVICMIIGLILFYIGGII
ncbi:MAG: hypothetical protein IJR82_04205 [Bacilli bacterium]|nr:hypothetical protein [Bacilli bacterium]